MFRSLLDLFINIEILISDESPYFCYYAFEILRATDVVWKSCKRKHSKSLVTTIITIHEFNYIFACNFWEKDLLNLTFYRRNAKNRGVLLISKSWINKHLKKNFGSKTLISYVNMIWCEHCALKIEPLHIFSSIFGIRLF